MSTHAPSSPLRLGFDAGSISLKVLVLDSGGQVLEQRVTRMNGRPVETALEALDEIASKYPGVLFDVIAGTGSAGRFICELLDVPFINEVIAQATAIRQLEPSVRTLIEMGGQDSKLILLPSSSDDPRPMSEFFMNSNCAAGTGSFLDQQASRLGVSIEHDFGELALRSVNPPRVAGRCSVFAKSDMIHLQQLATPVHDIIAGLCMGLARNLKSNLAGGRDLPKPFAFCGGVAANRGVVHALRQVFELDANELIVPELHMFTGALGAIHVALSDRTNGGTIRAAAANAGLSLETLRHYLASPHCCDGRLAPLVRQASYAATHVHAVGADSHPQGVVVNAWLGLDVGSISTKIAVIDEANHVLAKIYLMTAGRPLEAVRKVLAEIGQQIAGLPFPVIIRGAATTGSGRYLTGDVIGADLVINEITAQAAAAAALDPRVDTIFEIGGQDSKYIALDHGVVVDFEMNHACAAGTGSFLEEQAERLGISIKDQFAQMALASRSPIRLGERCTVFMESDLLSHQQQGASTPDLVAGLCYSIVSNYINRVVGRRRIGDRILFQGGTAFNGGVVAAFEAVTGRQITVPPHHEVTGAIGAAILARQHMRRHGGTTRFAGFDAENVDYQVRSFECEHCSNRCEINEVTAPGREPLYYGSRCDRYNRTKDREDTPAIPNLFAERQRLLFRYAHLPHGKPAAGRPTVGVPLALMNYQLLPFWGTLLAKLGLHVVVSPHSTADVIRSGVQAVLSTPCFPVKVAHGHLLELIRRGVDYVWLPSIVTLKKEFDENKFNQACPYITAFPYTMAAALKLQEKTVSMLAPVVRLEHGPHEAFRGLKALCGQLGVSKRRMWRAVLCGWAAQNKFERACRARGREVLANIPEQVRPIVVMARPYNGCDNALSLNLPTKLQRLNVLAIPLDFLDFSSDPSTHDRVFEWMYWKNGQRILHAARFVRQHPRLHAIYLSSFSCGPDSFLLGYFKRLMAPKPSLVLEIDEHSADGGVVTRLEAFIESLNAAPAKKLPVALPLLSSIAAGNGHRRRLFIPWMGDAAHGVAAGLRAKGVDAQVLPPSDASSVELGRRFCEGKECLPCIITTGDMLRVTQQPHFDAKATAFFMPRSCGPCRFGQYASLQKLILAELGHDQVAIIDPSDDSGFYNSWSEQIGQSSRLSWSAVCAIDALERAVLASRPYEKRAGDTDRLYQRLLHDLIGVIEKDPPLEQIVRFSTEAAHAFAALPVHRRRRKPLIGIVGENYVRLHHGANNQLVRQLEGYGAETTVASFLEYLYYTNWTRMKMAVRDRSARLWGGNLLQDIVQRRIARQIGRPFHDLLGDIEEPRTARLLQRTAFCVNPELEGGEAVLCAAKTLEWHEHGVDGVIAVMPFGCMPTTIFAGLTKSLAEETGNMPLLTIAYDGQQDATLQTRLEAFAHQARMYRQAMRRESRLGRSRRRRVRRTDPELPVPCHRA